MGWQYFKSNDGPYEVNWEVVSAIIRSDVRTESISKNKHPVTESHKWNPFLPDVTTIEVNWDAVREETRMGTELRLQQFYVGAQSSMRAQIRQLQLMTENSRARTNAFLKEQKEAQRTTMGNIESSVHHGEIAVTALTLLRDTCAEFDMVAATAFSGGLAAGVVGTAGGSLVKGTASYTETKKLGSAVATFGANFALGMLDVGVAGKLDKLRELGKISKIEKFGYEFVWAKAQAMLEIPKALMEGKDIKHAALSGAVKIGSASPLSGIDYWLTHNKKLEKFAFPVKVLFNVIQDRTAEHLASTHSVSEKPRMAPRVQPQVERPMHACVFARSHIETTAVRPLFSSASGR